MPWCVLNHSSALKVASFLLFCPVLRGRPLGGLPAPEGRSTFSLPSLLVETAFEHDLFIVAEQVAVSCPCGHPRPLLDPAGPQPALPLGNAPGALSFQESRSSLVALASLGTGQLHAWATCSGLAVLLFLLLPLTSQPTFLAWCLSLSALCRMFQTTGVISERRNSSG